MTEISVLWESYSQALGDSETGVEFALEQIIWFSFKNYVNFVYNYMLEKLNFNMDGIDVSKLNIIKYTDNKALERHIRNACCHDRIIVESDVVTIYDETNSSENKFLDRFEKWIAGSDTYSDVCDFNDIKESA